MTSYKIAVFVGSLRAASINLRFARALEKLAPANVTFEYVNLGELTLYNQDHENDPPASVVKLKQQIAEASAMLFVTPEHNRSIPAALKNAIDWGSRPWGHNSWPNKTVGIVGTSPSAAGTAMAQQHLRNVLAAEGANVLTTPEMFLQYVDGLIDDNYQITNENTRKFIQRWLDIYLKWVERLAS